MSYENPKLVLDEFGLPMCIDGTPDVPLATCRQDPQLETGFQIEGEGRGTPGSPLLRPKGPNYPPLRGEGEGLGERSRRQPPSQGYPVRRQVASGTSGISRRGFIQVVAVAGAGLILGCALPGNASSGADDDQAGLTLNTWIQIGTDGVVTITVSKPDMGQGPRTSLAMVVADELGADWSKVKVVQAPADEAKYGPQGVGGSGSIRGMFQPLRIAGATARAMLVAAAAKKLGVDASTCTVKNGIVQSGSKKATFAELAVDAAKQAVPDRASVNLKTPSEFTIIGKPTRRVDNQAIVTGKAMFGMDAPVKGVKVAVIARPPSFGGRAVKWDEEAAKKVPGVRQILEFRGGVAVIADDTWAALKGRDALAVEWDDGPNAGLDSAKITEAMKAQVGEHLAVPAGAKVVEGIYELPFLSHATMEPQNCTIELVGDRVRVWAPTQLPAQCQEAVASAMGIAADKVEVNITLLGGGFGRRLQQDFASEAGALARAAGVSLRLMWTRDDDMKHDFYRPASLHAVKAAVDASGNPVLWSHQYIQAGGRGGRSEFRSADIPYAIENSGMARGSAPSPVPTGAWRSVANTATGFINESLIDELAHLAGKDPVEYRLGLISNERLKNVIKLAAEKAGWGKKLAAGRFQGFGCFAGYGSFIAQVVEISIEGGEVKVHKVTAALDCGIAVNPLSVVAQVQGATTDALSTAIRAAITIENGGVVQTNFSNFRWLRIHEAPAFDVHIVPSEAAPGGMGELPYPAVSGALTNAIFAATGKRLRRLPIRRSDLA
ncbi:MAG: molybdopterin-dependent oxidoreductase [Fimbriimonadaceae bacterium]|nr:molybdopterin-dependent oxidoreductase [Fimbriimonadaceae bacterium]